MPTDTKKFTVCDKKYFFAACNRLAQLNDNICSAIIRVDDYEEVRAGILAVVGSAFCGQPMTVYVNSEYMDRLAEDCRMLSWTPSGLELKGILEIRPCEENTQADCELACLQKGEALSEKLRRIACNANYVYDAVRKRPPRWNDMVQALEHNDYNFASSLLQAMHAYVKMRAAGVAASDDDISMIVDYGRKLSCDEALRGQLLAMEHNRWLAFLAMYGYRTPSLAEIEEYAFVRIQGFRDKVNMLHPAAVPCSSHGKCALSQWSPDDWDKKATDSLDDLDRVSVELHRLAKKRAEEFQKPLDDLLDHYRREGIFLPDLNTALERLKAGQISEQAFEAAVEASAAELSDDDAVQIRRLAAPRIEYNRFTDYKASDMASVEQLGFILAFGRGRCRNLVRQLSISAEENAAAPVLLDPETLLLIIPENMSDDAAQRRICGIRTMIAQRSMMAKVTVARAENFTPDAYKAALEALCASSGLCTDELVVDVTGACAAFVEASAGLHAIYTRDLMVKNYRSCPEAVVFNSVHRTLTVDNLLALENYEMDPAWTVGNWSEIHKALPKLIQVYLDATKDGADKRWTECCKYLRENCQYLKISGNSKQIILSKSPNAQYNYRYSKTVRLEKAQSMNLTGLLKRLSACEVVIEDEYVVDEAKGEITYSGKACSANITGIFQIEAAEQLVLHESDGKYVVQQMAGTIQMPETGDAAYMLKRLKEAGILCSTGEGEDKCRYSSPGVRNVLLKEGNLLEDYLYHRLKLCGGYADAKLGCDYGPSNGEWDLDEHETDLFAINRKNHPVFFSCKIGTSIGLKDIMQVMNDKKSFGFTNGISVFVPSCSMENLQKLKMNRGAKNRVAGESKGIYFIDRETLSDPDKLDSMLLSISEA